MGRQGDHVTESRQQRRARQRQQEKRHRSVTVPATEADLVEGWSGGTDCTIRLATSADVQAITSLVEYTGIALPEALVEHLHRADVGAALLSGLRDGPDGVLQDAGAAFDRLTEPDLRPVYLRAALPLVAEHPTRGVVATLVAYPPMNVVEQFLDGAPRGERHKIALGGAVAFVKIKAVAVNEEFRGAGLGRALLQRCVQVYRQCRYTLLYGQFPAESEHLAGFYRRAGFTVHQPHQSINLWVLFGVDSNLQADHGERLFALWAR